MKGKRWIEGKTVLKKKKTVPGLKNISASQDGSRNKQEMASEKRSDPEHWKGSPEMNTLRLEKQPYF